MRIIKDCKTFNKYIEGKEADDDMDLIDLLDEATESISLPSYKTFLQNISEMRKGLRPSKYRKHYD